MRDCMSCNLPVTWWSQQILFKDDSTSPGVATESGVTLRRNAIRSSLAGAALQISSEGQQRGDFHFSFYTLLHFRIFTSMHTGWLLSQNKNKTTSFMDLPVLWGLHPNFLASIQALLDLPALRPPAHTQGCEAKTVAFPLCSCKHAPPQFRMLFPPTYPIHKLQASTL